MSATSAWKLERDADDIAWLTLDRPGSSANTLGAAVLDELDALLATLESRLPRGLVLRSAKTPGFIAGADVSEFTAVTSEADALALIRRGQRVIARLEALPCPSVAAIHGYALGGGLELALGCHYRVGVADERLSLGLPEVQLGIHPGFGGTVRAVRTLGVRAAMQLMLGGKPLRGEQARALGLVDRLVPPEQLADAARALVRERPARHQPPLADRLLGLAPLRPLLGRVLRTRVAARARIEHYPAPYAIVDLWVRHGARGTGAFEAEAASIARLIRGETARNLVRIFLLQERLKGLAGRDAARIRRVHVVGAGVMGGDIAAWCALRGLEVTLQDRELRYVEPALARAQALFARRIRDPAGRQAASARLRADVAGEGVPQADVVIEAIFEDLDAKRALYAALEPRMKSGAILATNTSSLPLEDLAARLADPARMIGLHFFNPVAQMPLIEIVQGQASGAAAVAAGLAFARRIDKLPLPCRSAPGFLVNRVLFPYLHEALHVASEGTPLTHIDAAAVDFGMPMGPIELADVVGLDVVLHVGEIITRELGRETPPFVQALRQQVAAGRLGRKSGQGFYVWHNGRPRRESAAGAPPLELADRLLLPLVNESVACLREGVVSEADLIDAGVIFGTGFAPFRGGPLAYARWRGAVAVRDRLQQLASQYGARFRPDPGWEAFIATPGT
ncbi:MAG: enoyl-CoA hydratase/isomerase family protein [Gammaproteobacteria bacterium]|nr:enoyl-CoA hydratase/isomerase family protein [Gammaproteobacteria bacterium]